MDLDAKLDKTLQRLEASLQATPAKEDTAALDDDEASLIDQMLRLLTHKDILYDPLKEIALKFPDYLRSQDGSQTLVDQFELLQKIIAAYERADASDVAQCETVFDLLQALQELGPLPSQLLADLDLAEEGASLSTLLKNGL